MPVKYDFLPFYYEIPRRIIRNVWSLMIKIKNLTTTPTNEVRQRFSCW
jgi:hypothetical protein